MEKYRALLSECSIGKMKLRNRVIMSAMATNLADSSGNVTEKLIDYYVERAKGETGLIVIENANVDYPQGANGAVQLRIDEDRFIPGLANLRDALYDVNSDCKVAIQINHPGAQTRSSRTCGLQVVGPSDVPTTHNGEVPRPLTKKEIEELAHKFANAAKRAQRAGFDAIEIHGGFCYLLGQFISPLYNKRTDEYGGSLENRMRFPLMVIHEVRRLVGDDFPILFRMNGEEFIEGGLTLQHAKQNARLLEKASVNLVHITAGNGYRISKHIEPMSYKEGWKVYLSSEIKKVVSIPVATVGVIRKPSMANEIISSGKSDFIAIGRGLIADPYWVKKAYEGKEDEINKCISCYECASRRLFLDLPIRCTVNPTAGKEKFEKERILKVVNKKKVIVIGGGPAGMKAAIEAKREGHEVILFEKENSLGGKGLIALLPPYKDKIGWFIEILKKQIENYDIEVKLNTYVDCSVVKEYQPDVIIMATGSNSFIPSILGLEDSNFITYQQLLLNRTIPASKRIGIIGGGSVGCECAEYVSCNGNIVTMFELMDDVAIDQNTITRLELTSRLEEHKVKINTGCIVNLIDKEGIVYTIKGKEEKVQLDMIVIATGASPNKVLLNELNENNIIIPIFLIGDCYKPGKLIDTQRQAVTTIRKINELV